MHHGGLSVGDGVWEGREDCTRSAVAWEGAQRHMCTCRRGAAIVDVRASVRV